MIKTYNIKDKMPSIEIALKRFDNCLKEAKKQGLKIIKVIHGYGSSGVGGDIKISFHIYLKKLKSLNQIKAYIPGEAFRDLLGFDTDIKTYKSLIANDQDSKIGNQGITYIVL